VKAQQPPEFRRIRSWLAGRLVGGALAMVAWTPVTAVGDPAYAPGGPVPPEPTEPPRVANLKALSALPRQPRSAVIRDGYGVAGDAPPLAYVSTDRPCPINGGDGGSQVPTSDGGCWIAQFDGPPDAREWGQSYPFTMHVSSAGTDDGGKGWCFTACATVQQAVTQACRMNFQGRSNVVAIDGVFSGPGFTLSGECPGQGGPQVSGQYLYLQGTLGAGSVTLTAAAGPQIFDIEASSGALLLIRKLTLSVASGGYGLFSQNAGTVVEVGDGVRVTGAPTAQAGLYAEGLGQIELATSQTLTLEGQFVSPLQANTGGYIEFDPEGKGTVSCGTGLSIVPGGGFLTATGGRIMWSSPHLSGCASVTGDPIKATNNGAFFFDVGTQDPPGDGYVRMNAGAVIEFLNGAPVYVPSLGTCPNGVLDPGATNNDFSVSFTGANSGCAIRFGKPAAAKAYYAGRPICVASTDTGGAGPTVGFASLSRFGFTAIASSPFANNQLLQVHCSPLNGG
jgi:hypothetical protein